VGQTIAHHRKNVNHPSCLSDVSATIATKSDELVNNISGYQ
jgi:hypothetical protein